MCPSTGSSAQGSGATNSSTCTPCPAGTFYNGRDGMNYCQTCPYGMSSNPGSSSCFVCPATQYGYFVTVGSIYGGGIRLCKDCDYPMQTNNQNYPEAQCNLLCLCLSSGYTAAMTVSLAAIFVGSLALFLFKNLQVNWRILIGLLTYIAIPFIDNLTDLAFILTNQFASREMFIAMCFFFLLPNVLFIQQIRKKKSYPRFYQGLLFIFNYFRIMTFTFPPEIFFEHYDTLYKVLFTSICNAPFIFINIIITAIIAVPFLLYVIVWSIFVVPCFTLGSYLFVSKAFAIRMIADQWFSLWSGAEAEAGDDVGKTKQQQQQQQQQSVVDTSTLNESLIIHFFFETFPLLVIQIINNSILNKWTPLGIASVTFSALNAFNGIYRFAYHRIYLGTKIAEIPVDFSIGGVNVFSISELEASAPSSSSSCDSASVAAKIEPIVHNPIDFSIGGVNNVFSSLFASAPPSSASPCEESASGTKIELLVHNHDDEDDGDNNDDKDAAAKKEQQPLLQRLTTEGVMALIREESTARQKEYQLLREDFNNKFSMIDSELLSLKGKV